MGCLQSGPRLYDDHELLDNLNFEDEDNEEMHWEDDALIAAADDIVGSSALMTNGGRVQRNQSRILTNEEIQRITRDKMAQIVAEQQARDTIVDAALAQADEDQRLEEEAEMQSLQVRSNTTKEPSDDFESQGFRGLDNANNDEDFEDFLENVKSKSLLTKVASITTTPSRSVSSLSAGTNGRTREDSLNDTVMSSAADPSFHDAENFDDFVGSVSASPAHTEVSAAVASDSDTSTTTYATTVSKEVDPTTATVAELAQELPPLDLPDLRNLQADPLEASHTDFSFAE